MTDKTRQPLDTLYEVNRLLPEPQGRSQPGLPESAIDAAIAWAVRLDYNKPSADELHAFESWKNASLEHALAWDRIHSASDFASKLNPAWQKVASETLNTVQLYRASCRQRRNALKMVSSIGIAATTGWLLHENAPWQRLIAQTSTRIGEQKSLQLSDGTGLVLNSDSAISTDFENSARIIVLHRGEVAITTGDDHKATNRLGYKRPFLVHTPFGKMQALGTRFVVRLDKDGAQVSVQDGAVRLYPSSGITSIMIEKGSSLRMLKNAILPAELHRFAPDYWVAGAISGTNIPLHELLTEIERYRVGRIICDTRIGSLPITGTFHIRDADRALAFLARTQPISLQYLTRFWVRVHPRST